MDTLLALLQMPLAGKEAWIWLVFIGVVITLLALDLGVLHKDEREIEVKESLLLSGASAGCECIMISASSGMFWGFFIGRDRGLTRRGGRICRS